jgi:hypothetical protein
VPGLPISLRGTTPWTRQVLAGGRGDRHRQQSGLNVGCSAVREGALVRKGQGLAARDARVRTLPALAQEMEGIVSPEASPPESASSGQVQVPDGPPGSKRPGPQLENLPKGGRRLRAKGFPVVARRRDDRREGVDRQRESEELGRHDRPGFAEDLLKHEPARVENRHFVDRSEIEPGILPEDRASDRAGRKQEREGKEITGTRPRFTRSFLSP